MVEKLEPCPYNSSHQIIPHRMAKHIIKCKKNYPDAQMKVCIFNAVHVVPVHQYQAHLLECESRELVEREVYCRPRVVQTTPLAKAEALPVQDGIAKCENWELECVQSSYRPEEHVIYKEFTRPPPPGLGKAARKQWRLSEIDRVNRLKNGMIVDPQSDTSTATSKMSTTSMNSGWSATGAVPKHQDKFKHSLSKIEPATMIGEKVERDRCLDTVTSVFSPISSEGTLSDKSQNQKNGRDMTDFIREKRKLEKKLFEIKKLESMKINSNEKLTEQEEAKILTKESIEGKLANLMTFLKV